MLNDITLGQYFPGNSLLHRADARMKLISAVAFLVAVFLASGDVSFLFMLLLTGIIIVISGISFKTILRSLRPLVVIIAFTAAISIFWAKGDELIFEYGAVHIYKEGIALAVFMVLRMVCIVSGSFVLLTYTTSPTALTDALESLISPLKRLGVPVHEFAMMMTIALRFVSPLIEETDRIICAQKARGADFESGRIISRIKTLVPVLIPLFVSAFRRAMELAQAMECRCYTGGEGRTRMKRPSLRPADFILPVVIVAAAVAVVPLNGFSLWP